MTRRRGFTLVELVVVAAILVVLAGLVLGRLGGVEEHAEAPLLLADLFRTPPHLPPELRVFDPIAGRGWNGPYLDPAAARAAKGGLNPEGKPDPIAVFDGWGRPIALQNPTPDGAFARLVSAGPDGVFQTPPGAADVDPSDPAQVGDDFVAYLTHVPGS